jgi:hypothetical protein
MKRELLLVTFSLLITFVCFAQNVGIGTTSPTEKLNVDSGNIRIGGVNTTWQNASTSRFLKFGDNNYITLGEEEGDDKLTIRARELLFRPSPTYTSLPLSIQGSTNYSHFFFGNNEDTYIRAGKNNANVIINDIAGGKVGIGMNNPTRAMLEQNGSVGATAAIFGGDGTGISLQHNWPAIGFNSYLDGGGHKSMAQGYGAQLGLNQINGSLYLVSFPFNASANTTFSSYTQRFYISRFGQIGIGTDIPTSDIHVVQRNFTDANDNTDMGLTLEATGNFEIFPNTFYNTKWNLHIGYGVANQFAGLDFLSFWRNTNNSFWYRASAIGTDGTYYQLSDRNRKTDISYLYKSSLEKIMELRPAKYHFKETSRKSEFSYGFIAQDVEKIFPEFVASFSDSKMLNYTAFIPILTKGIQEQQQQIETLQKENVALKARMERLEKLMLKN